MAGKLTARFAEMITKPGRHGDGNGLYLVVKPSGAKSWVLRTVVHGRRCDIGLGGFPLVSLAEAREAAFDNRKLAVPEAIRWHSSGDRTSRFSKKPPEP